MTRVEYDVQLNFALIIKSKAPYLEINENRKIQRNSRANYESYTRSRTRIVKSNRTLSIPKSKSSYCNRACVAGGSKGWG